MNTKNTKKKIKKLFIPLLIIIMLCGCGQEQTCSYCGEKKQCKKYDILGVERYICEECLVSSNAVSNNVVAEYKAEDLHQYYEHTSEDDGTSSEGISTAEDSSVSNNSSNNDNNSSDNSGNSQMSNNDIISNRGFTIRSRSDILSSLNSLLSSKQLSLIQDSDDTNKYSISSLEGKDLNISLEFAKDSSGNTTLSVIMEQDSNSADYTNTCICSELAFINSTDFENKGYDIFNKSVMHGNYTLDGCRFYYMENSSNNSSSIATFDISFQ